MQFLHMYNHNHSQTWDDNLPYIKHSYNHAQHNSMGNSPFDICYGFQPSTPIDLISSSTQSNDTDFKGQEVDKALKFRYKIYNIHKQAQYMTRHDKHRISHSFQIGDQVWLHLKKECASLVYTGR